MLFLLILVFVGMSVCLAWYLLAHDHGEREPVLALWMAAGFGLIGAVLAALLETKLVSADSLLPGAASGPLLKAALSIGVIEEACKFLPLAVILYGRRYFNEHTDGVIYFALAGMSFGLLENMLYTLQFGTKTGLMRAFLTPLFHAATTGLVGYYLARTKMTKRSPFWVAIPLAAMMLVHGFYDFGLTSNTAAYGALAIMTTLGLSAGLFMLYLRASEHDQDMGLSVVGHNAFCRSCGSANPSTTSIARVAVNMLK